MDEDIRGRMKGRRDYTGEIIKSGPAKVPFKEAYQPPPARPVEHKIYPDKKTELTEVDKQDETEEKPQKAKPKKQRRWPKILLVNLARILVLIAIVTGLFFGWQFIKHNSSPLPSNIIKPADFTVYYPKPVPSEFVLKQNSTNFENGIVIYILENDNQTITVAQQAAPLKVPKLEKIEGFHVTQTPVGSAAIGKNNKTPTAIVETPTTLISVTGSSNVSSTTLGAILQNLKPIN